MSKLLSRKGIILILLPVFVIILQSFLRLVLKLDFNTIGITLASLGLGQLLPFCYFDHFIANKIMGISPTYKTDKNQLQITYKTKANVPVEEIDSLKNLFLIAIFLNLLLFLVTIYAGSQGYICLHIIFGLISCIISWYLLVFK